MATNVKLTSTEIAAKRRNTAQLLGKRDQLVAAGVMYPDGMAAVVDGSSAGTERSAAIAVGCTRILNTYNAMVNRQSSGRGRA